MESDQHIQLGAVAIVNIVLDRQRFKEIKANQTTVGILKLLLPVVIWVQE